MKGEQHEIKKAAEEVGQGLKKEKSKEVEAVTAKLGKGVPTKDILGLNDQMVEGIYGQAYRLYNTGKYKDASQLFRLLIMLNPAEAKYPLGLAACFHMMKDYESAIQMYTVCGMTDPQNPIPHYHASDCYLQLGDKVSAMIALEMAMKRSGERPEFKTIKDRAALTVESLKQEISKPKEI